MAHETVARELLRDGVAVADGSVIAQPISSRDDQAPHRVTDHGTVVALVISLDGPRDQHDAAESSVRDQLTVLALEDALTHRQGLSLVRSQRESEWANLRRGTATEWALNVVAAIVAPLVLLPLLGLSWFLLRGETKAASDRI